MAATTTTTEAPEVPKIEVDYGELITTMLDMVRATWPLWALIVAIGTVRLLLAIRRQRRLARSRISEIDLMDGHTFERYLQTLFQRQGYRVEHVGARGGDYGGDLLIRKNGTRTLVQAKRYAKNVGIPAVQQAVTAKAMYDCTEAMVVTNSGFTQQAQKLALANKVRLVGRDELVTLLLDAQKSNEGSAVAPVALPVALAEPAPTAVSSCARCGERVSEKCATTAWRTRIGLAGSSTATTTSASSSASGADEPHAGTGWQQLACCRSAPHRSAHVRTSGSAATPPLYKNRTALNKKYPHGIGKLTARDKTTGTPVTTFTRSNTLYATAMRHNRGLDRDKDGIACEKK